MGIFEPAITLADTETTRECGVCREIRERTEFYSDGKNSDGSKKLRRDCKECYRIARLRTRRNKRCQKK
jgi:hypothetical protein